MRKLGRIRVDRAQAPNILQLVQKVLQEVDDEDERQRQQRLIERGYICVRKVCFFQIHLQIVKTPTRTLFLPAEWQMSNRVFRRFDNTAAKVLRLQFRSAIASL